METLLVPLNIDIHTMAFTIVHITIGLLTIVTSTSRYMNEPNTRHHQYSITLKLINPLIMKGQLRIAEMIGGSIGLQPIQQHY